jgi:dihydroxy-acid dehydratase
MVGHMAPEAVRGGPIALLREGDRIRIDAGLRAIETDADLAERRKHWTAPAPKVTTGALAKYARLVGSASDGANTHPDTAVSTPAHITPEHIQVTATEGVTA